MAMSATAAAKRRRAGGVLSSPMLQPPHILQSIPPSKLISTLQNIQQVTLDQSKPIENLPQSHNAATPINMSNVNNIDPNRGLTLQQVIKLLDTRLINLEKNKKPELDSNGQSNVSDTIDNLTLNVDFHSKIEETVSHSETRIQESCLSMVDNAVSKKLEDVRYEMLQSSEEIALQHIGEFNHRYELLATEILNLKNLVLDLQNYTMRVNKMLLEERMNVFSELTSNQFKTTGDEIKLESEVVNLNDEILVEPEVEPEMEPETIINEDVLETRNEEKEQATLETDTSDFLLVSSKSKKGRVGKNQKKKNNMVVEQEVSLSI